MKSAYELAMRRLDKENPLPKVDDRTKALLAEVDAECTAKVAERTVFLEGEIAKRAGDPSVGELRAELARDIARIEEQRQRRKEEIRKGA